MSASDKKTFWSADWFAGVLFVALFALVAFVLARPAFYSLETAFYDHALTLRSAAPSERVAIVAIDEDSIDNVGRWPWSRDVMAAGIDQLRDGGADVIAYTTLVSEPDIDAGVDHLRDLQRFVDDSTLSTVPVPDANLDEPAVPTLNETPDASDVEALQARIREAIESIDYDGRLAASMAAAGNVILPLELRSPGTPAGRPGVPTPSYVAGSRVPASAEAAGAAAFRDLMPPLARLGEQASGVGHTIKLLDSDGAVRSEPLIADYHGELYPSLALITALKALNLTPEDLQVRSDGLQLGGMFLPTTGRYQLLHQFYNERDGRPPFRVDSFYDVFTGQVPVDKFRGRIVLFGATASGIGDQLATPVGGTTPPVVVLAHTVSALLNGDFVTRPGWAAQAEIGVLLVLALYLVFLLPKLRAGMAAFISLALSLSLVVAALQALVGNGLWLQFMVPLALLLSGHLVMTVKRFGVTERLKQHADAAGAESNRMLGLAFQGQGQLDMAFEKFRKCPLDSTMMEPLYNLALDYERKRQHNKAATVYSLMAEHDPGYRDLPARLRRSQELEETLILGGPGRGSAGAPLVLEDENIQKPMLGRYQVEREIGKGAMGTVYLGRDPKINRIVAIKTIALAQEFDEDEVGAVRDRFFREAETAGRLSHPDIVTVYDAGEEHDLAYIAMEFLKGEHLSIHTRSNALLPTDTVVDLMARVADALDYAHRADVVHRDIKPANIMYNPETSDLKITDFGIARITSSSKTKTGIVLGTPSYMSPEQLAGKNVTGRSDLFSLGVTLYQLLAGQLPFRADSMASLMYKIANEEHTPLRSARPELPVCLEEVVTRALAKDADERYQSGSEMALDLRKCIAHLAA